MGELGVVTHKNIYGVRGNYAFFTVDLRGEIMGVKLITSFRNRYYSNELMYCKTIGIDPLSLDLLRKRNTSLNYSNFKSEVWFVNYLKKINLDFECHRNYPILNRFFADFYFKELKLVVEIDGLSHRDSQEYDLMRDKLFSKRGLTVIRVKYLDCKKAEEVCTLIGSKIQVKQIKNELFTYEFNKPVPNKRKKDKQKSVKRKKRKVNKLNSDAWNKMMLDALKK